ncbi:NHP2 protein, partial [Atractosteus spatula]|nr:NHP2 protein [Atractosteus spatula]
MTKAKKEKAEEESGSTENTYQDLIANINAIAQPLASRKLTKKLYKCVKKASKQKQIRRGVKEVQKFINKGEKGIVVLAGDTLPIDVYCHIPVMCEDRSLPYAYVPSKVVRIPRYAIITPSSTQSSRLYHLYGSSVEANTKCCR